MYDYCNVVAFIFDLCGNEFATQILIVTLLFFSVLKKRKLFYVRYPLCLATIIGAEYLFRFGYLPVPEPLNYIIVLAMLVGTIALCYRANFSQSLFIGVCIYCGQFILSSLSYVIIFTVMYLTQNPANYAYYYVVMPIVTAACAVAIYYFMARWIKNREELNFNSHIIIYITLSFALVATTLTLFARKEIFWSLLGQVYLLSISVLFTITTLIMGFNNIQKLQLEEENKILQQLLHKDKLHYEQAKLSNEKIMIKYHDMKQHTSQGIVDYESLKEIEPDNEILKSTYFTGNRALDIILSEKALMCERFGIRFICTADGSALDFMKSYHIYSLVGNALENSIDSLKKEQDDHIKELTVSITRAGDMCVFKVENFASQKVVFSDGLPVTNKGDNSKHGFGAKSMRNIVQRYGGELKFLQENEIFTVIAMIPIPNK